MVLWLARFIHWSSILCYSLANDIIFQRNAIWTSSSTMGFPFSRSTAFLLHVLRWSSLGKRDRSAVVGGWLCNNHILWISLWWTFFIFIFNFHLDSFILTFCSFRIAVIAITPTYWEFQMNFGLLLFVKKMAILKRKKHPIQGIHSVYSGCWGEVIRAFGLLLCVRCEICIEYCYYVFKNAIL